MRYVLVWAFLVVSYFIPWLGIRWMLCFRQQLYPSTLLSAQIERKAEGFWGVKNPTPQNQQTKTHHSSFCPVTEISLGFQTFVTRCESQFTNVSTYIIASVGNGEKGEIEISLGSVEKDRNHCMEGMSDSYGHTAGVWRSTTTLQLQLINYYLHT